MSDAAAASTYSHATTDNTNTPEPVNVLPWNHKALVWPASGVYDFFLFAGAIFFPPLFGMMLSRVHIVFLWVGVALSVVFMIAAFNVAIRGFRAKMGQFPYSGPLPQGDTGRLRVLSPSRQLSSAIEAFSDASFEPIIFRSIRSVRFGELDGNSRPKMPEAKANHAPSQSAETTTHITASRTLADTASFLMAVAIVLIVQRMAIGSWWWGLRNSSFTIFSAIALTVLISAFVKPTYLRISPGALDVLIYPPLGFGPPHCERYNLRAASIRVDDRVGWIGVFDTSRTERQALFVRRGSVLARRNVGALILNASRSTHPTPPLPTDALLG